MKQPEFNSFFDGSKIIMDMLLENYLNPLNKYIRNYPELLKTFPGFLILPERIILYFGKTHMGIEYTGPERVDCFPEKLNLEVQIFDYTQSDENFFEKIIGFSFDDSTSSVQIPLPQYLEELIMPTNRGIDKLIELNWKFGAQDSMIMFNSFKPSLMKNKFTRIVNSLFFDADETGLKTRHIKWIDFVPVIYDDSDPEHDSLELNLSFYKTMIEEDCRYVYSLPDTYDYQNSKLQRINRLIELVGDKKTKELEITKFLSMPENHFILAMRFGGVSVHSEVICEWQSDDKKPLRPDFFVVKPNGFADIVEFKLPTIENKLIVGRINREAFSSKINSYIAQTRKYSDYFDDPNNRRWFEDKYGYKVHRPRRYLVIGRRWDFDSDIWREIISDYKDIELVTYDDLVDGVTAQIYL